MNERNNRNKRNKSTTPPKNVIDVRKPSNKSTTPPIKDSATQNSLNESTTHSKNDINEQVTSALVDTSRYLQLKPNSALTPTDISKAISEFNELARQLKIDDGFDYYGTYFTKNNSELLNLWIKEIEFYIFKTELINELKNINKEEMINIIVNYKITKVNFDKYINEYNQSVGMSKNINTMNFLDSYAVDFLNYLRSKGIDIPHYFYEEDVNYTAKGFKYIRCINSSILSITGKSIDIRSIVTFPPLMNTLFYNFIDYYKNNVKGLDNSDNSIITASARTLPSFLSVTSQKNKIKLRKGSALYKLAEKSNQYYSFIDSVQTQANMNAIASIAFESHGKPVDFEPDDGKQHINTEPAAAVEVSRYPNGDLGAFITASKALGNNPRFERKEEKGLNSKLNDLIDTYSEIPPEFEDIYKYFNEI